MKKRRRSPRISAPTSSLESFRERIRQVLKKAQYDARAILPSLGKQEYLTAFEVALLIEADLSRVADNSHLHRISGLRAVRRGHGWKFTVGDIRDYFRTHDAKDESEPAESMDRQLLDK
jgi:hypothetical protein